MKINLPTLTLGLLPEDGWPVNSWIEIEFEAETISGMIEDIGRRYPKFIEACLPPEPIRTPISFRVNGTNVRYGLGRGSRGLHGIQTPIKEGDEILLVTEWTAPWQ